MAVELGGGLPLLVPAVDEDPRAVVQALGVEVLVSDDLGSWRSWAWGIRSAPGGEGPFPA